MTPNETIDYEYLINRMLEKPDDAELAVILVSKRLFQEDEKEEYHQLRWYVTTWQLIKNNDKSIDKEEIEVFLDIHMKAVKQIKSQGKIDLSFIFNNPYLDKL